MYTREEKQGIEDNNIHTSVVIELANPKGEPEEQKSYQIEIDDLNAPKDYVIDQIFCGENITIYALIEVSENENRTLDKNLIKVPNSNIGSDNTFFYRNSCKKITNDRQFNVCKQNSSAMPSEENSKFFSDTNKRNNSFYCLKHPSGNHDLLAPERKKSDLKVLYNKNFSLERTNSTKFKAISVGVNTDIVQSPRIIEEVQKMLGVNVPVVRAKEKSIETSNSSSMPSYDFTEVETRPSYSSFDSSIDTKNCSGKSVSNLFFVPFLMMEDDNFINKLSRNSISQKNPEEEKLLNVKFSVSKVSLGINTDESEFDSGIELNRQQNGAKFSPESVEELSGILLKDDNAGKKLKPSERKTILQEIKTMQLKLSALFKKIESSDLESDCDPKDYFLDSSEHKISHENIENNQNVEPFLQNEFENFDKDEENFGGLGHETLTASHKGGTQNAAEEKKEEAPTKTMDFSSLQHEKEPFVSEFEMNNERLEPKMAVSNAKISWKSSGSSVVSKSEINLNSNKKINCLRKSWSLDFKTAKTDVFKNIKSFSFKQEGRLSANAKERTHAGKEVNSGDDGSVKKCEVGFDALKNINFRLITVTPCEENKKKETPIETQEIDLDEKKTPDEEIDVKSAEPKKEEPPIGFIKPEENQHVPFSEPEPSVGSCEKEPPASEPEMKTCKDSEKSPTSSGSFRKTITANSNIKKDSKLIKKTFNRYKVTEAIKPEIPFKRIIAGGRKPMKNLAESKLHIDKIIKAEGLKNLKTSSPFKRNSLEKSTAKGNRNSRPSSQKFKMREGPADALGESKTENKLFKRKSASSLQIETPTKKRSSPKSKIEGVFSFDEPDTHLASQKRNTPSESSSVTVRLLSKKPKSLKSIYSRGSQECLNMENVTGETHGTHANEAAKETNESMEKPVVKSVWALTKVLLFEDGTKKLEVLEASLTPPKVFLKSAIKTSK